MRRLSQDSMDIHMEKKKEEGHFCARISSVSHVGPPLHTESTVSSLLSQRYPTKGHKLTLYQSQDLAPAAWAFRYLRAFILQYNGHGYHS